ncbi:hypothetical protein F4604DRAFT_1688603 [Suillus subluteus]|nr:hypothetical protein F4604DRAFT_1688603 [Suillus subluteus]
MYEGYGRALKVVADDWLVVAYGEEEQLGGSGNSKGKRETYVWVNHSNNSELLDDTGDEDEELEDLPLLDNHQDLPFNEVGYYMGGVGGGLRLDTVHHRQLESLVEEDEPD